MNNQAFARTRPLVSAAAPSICARDRRVIQRAAERARLSRDANRLSDTSTAGPRWADRLAAVVGSRTFVIGFALVVAAWAGLDALVLAGRSSNSGLVLVLNLILPMLAVLQAAAIVTSRDWRPARDRMAVASAAEANRSSAAAMSDLHEQVDRLTARIEQLAESGAAAPEPARPAPPRLALRVA